MSNTTAAEPSLAAAFTREHHEIDAGIDEYLKSGEADPEARAIPLLRAMEALRRHIYLEEEIVFPHLPPGPLMMSLMVMRREHGELWRCMDQLADQLASATSASDDIDACCREILELLEKHNVKEEPVIYPHLDSDLSPQGRKHVQELLSTGRLPSGWICQEATTRP